MIRQLTRLRFFTSAKDSPLESDIQSLRRQLIYRSNHLGIKQLDLVVGSWADINIPKLSKQELLDFNSQVLKHEVPELLKKVLGQLQIEKDEPMVGVIRQFARDGTVSKIENL